MATNPPGQLFRSSEIEKNSQVIAILLTPQRITLGWTQDGETCRLDAKSKDGIHFHGQYGCVPNEADFKCELTLFQAQGAQLLFGTWWENGTALQGILAFRLPLKPAERAAARESSPVDKRKMPAERPSYGDRPSPGKIPGLSDRQPVTKPSPTANQPAVAEQPRVEPKPPVHVPAKALEAVRPAMGRPTAPAPAPASAQVDHLLLMTGDQFSREDREALERELAGAPLSAVFKVAHNAAAPELRTLALTVFTTRYGGLTPAEPLAPVRRPAEPAEFKAIKRRSSRHSKNPQ